MSRKRSIMMYGRSRSGKTSQLGELSEHILLTTGKKLLVYSIDAGGTGPIEPYIGAGLIDLIIQGDTNPWLFLAKAARGQVKDTTGKWVPADFTKYGGVGIESFTGFGDSLMLNLAEQAAQGTNIGGGANVSFSVTSDGETIKVGGSNMAHYGICQARLLDEFLRSQKLPVDYVVWTASASKEDDQNNGGKVIGPAGPGKALTSEIPRHCDLCFRIDCVPAQMGKPERHIIYLGNSVDPAAGNAVCLGNTRVPLGGNLPSSVEPASIVKVLDLIAKAEIEAVEALNKRIKVAPRNVSSTTPKV